MSAPRVETRASVSTSGSTAVLAVAWAIVGIPAAWGFWQTVTKALALFR